MKPGMSETEKLEYAKKIGVSTQGVHDTEQRFFENELNFRILNHERSIRESRLWVVAVVSAIASALSALAAWAAVLRSHN